MKLSPKVILLVLSVLVVSMSLLAIPLYWYSRAALEDELGDQLMRINRIMAAALDLGQIGLLADEPGLTSVRQRVENDLTALAVPGIEGLTLYRQDGTILAENHQLRQKIAGLSPDLPGLLALKNDTDPVVSEIYALEGGRYIKAAALPLRLDDETRVILAVWAGANYMTVIDEMAGSLLWIVLISVLIAITMTLVFSRSLIKPVRALSAYAQAIQVNLNSEPVDLGRSDEFGDLNHSLIEMHQEIQKQEEAARQLLAGIAHEIKNPLGGMEIYSGLLSQELSRLPADTPVEEYKTYLEKITGELNHLKRIVQEYLDYARPLKNVIEPLHIAEIHEDVVQLLRPELQKLGQGVSLEGDAAFQGDRSKLQRVFLNLIRNGLEASGQNGVIHIDVRESNGTLIIDFSDTGVGIPEGDWDRIFEPYFSTRDRGFGLGLSIVRSIVSEMGGTIVVQKSDPEGTVFRLTLPKLGTMEK